MRFLDDEIGRGCFTGHLESGDLRQERLWLHRLGRLIYLWVVFRFWEGLPVASLL